MLILTPEKNRKSAQKNPKIDRTLVNLSFGFVSLEFHRSFREFSSVFAQIYDPSDMFCAKKEENSSKISMDFEENEPKTQVSYARGLITR
jgi:hypothetical protein